MDTSKIAGYAEMTAEQKIAALEGYEPEGPDLSGYVKKELLDKAASEAAGYKKQLREKMTADEAAEADRLAKQQEFEDKYKDLETKYNALQQQNVIAEYKGKLVGLGYEEKLAAATAKAMAEGDMQTVFANQAKFMEAQEKARKAEALKKMGGSSNSGGEDDGGDDPNDPVALAKALGKAKAESGKGTVDILNQYTLK